MGTDKSDLSKLRQVLHATIVEVEVAMDTGTHPDWNDERELVKGT